MDGLRITFPRLIKPAPGILVKGLHIANIKCKPNHLVDCGIVRGVSTNVIIPSCGFERVGGRWCSRTNPTKILLLFKCYASREMTRV